MTGVQTCALPICQRHYDAQLMGGAALHFGWIAEMKTGEGKTLVSTLPVYLNGLTQRGVHVVTVNDYLANRDSDWMGQIHRFLGVSVGLLSSEVSDSAAKRVAYESDVTYSTNSELGFDFLRDNMAMTLEERVQRKHYYAIVDEVDSILIDEARTPHIISGRLADAAKLYVQFASIVRSLSRDVDYDVDEEKKQISPTESGIDKVEAALGVENIYDDPSANFVHHLSAALRAKELFKRDVDYLVADGEVKIVDEFTGRILEGRRWSEGLHQAVEAKERVKIKEENQTLATTTLQNYFRLYEKLAGMTGTAETEAGEFASTYNLSVVPIPTHRPMVRKDEPDLIYKNEMAKFSAVVNDIEERHAKGQPVLVGTVSVEKSELVSQLLAERKVPHAVLNAKYHASEAEIVAQAGRPGGVTVATNMAGRGVDILLGGNPEGLARRDIAQAGINPDLIDLDADDPDIKAALEAQPEAAEALVKAKEIFAEARPRYEELCKADGDTVRALGGLYVLATERHESRRIDNQLRGRSGRQGDPGLSKFYLSLDDDLLRIFGPDTMFSKMMNSNLADGEAIGSKWLSKAIETAQKKVEARNYDIRKQVVEYDDVMNDQRKVIYEQRNDILDADAVDEVVLDMRAETVNGLVGEACPPGTYPEQWDIDGLNGRIRDVLALELPIDEWSREEGMDPEALEARVREASDAHMAGKQADLEEGVWHQIEKSVLLQSVDHHWKEHLTTLDALKQVIHLRAYAQKTPINEYKREAFALFERMLVMIREDVTKVLAFAQFQQELPELPEMPAMFASHIDPLTGENDAIANPMGLITTRLPPLQVVQPEGDTELGNDPDRKSVV